MSVEESVFENNLEKSEEIERKLRILEKKGIRVIDGHSLGFERIELLLKALGEKDKKIEKENIENFDICFQKYISVTRFDEKPYRLIDFQRETNLKRSTLIKLINNEKEKLKTEFPELTLLNEKLREEIEKITLLQSVIERKMEDYSETLKELKGF
jgi:hypothetical protein